MHAALETVGESPFPAPAGMDLGLDDQIVRTEFARDLFRFLCRGGDPAGRRRGPEFLQQFFRLIFVNIHRTARWADVQLARESQASNGFFPVGFAHHVATACNRADHICLPPALPGG